MELRQLRCFVAVADDLHFGRAAQRLSMLPSALGRHIRLLEEELGTRLLARTTRNVALTGNGATLLEDARALIDQADAIAARLKSQGRKSPARLRVGAIDSAAAGIVPLLLSDFRKAQPDTAVQLVEDRTVRLLPRLISGRIDLAFVRPPEQPSRDIEFMFLFHETVVVALPSRHRLAKRTRLSIGDLDGQPLIVPERRLRPHSHDLTMQMFAEAGLKPAIAQFADEKQTIINMVAAKLGAAIVPRATSRLAVAGVRFVPLKVGSVSHLPLAAAWMRGTRDPARDAMLETLRARLFAYARRV